MMLITFIALLVATATGQFNEDLHNKFLTMPNDEFVEYFNKQNNTWTITEYDELIEDEYIACAFHNPNFKSNLPYKVHATATYKTLPKNFDSRQKWPKCHSIKEIYNQLKCGSCWTFGTASTASDRTCIHKNIHVRLSEEDFECMTKNVCSGNYPENAFKYWQTDGLVTQECKPYNVAELKQSSCKKSCANGKNYSKDKHFAEQVYAVSADIDNIKAELYKNGPVEASFAVYQDFKKYHGGVYTHTYGELLGYHSVRVIGYGVEKGVGYWLVANSWGTHWGEGGFFRIAQDQPDIYFENSMYSGLPLK